MYMVGANIVSTLSGKRYADFVKDRIFKPLGMSSSTYSIDAAIKTGRFTNTWSTFGRLIPPWIREEFVGLIAGPGGVISSAKDLVRYAIGRNVSCLTCILSRHLGLGRF
jgi:CubicO group peptidase (beta-lactamase class C family)